MSAGEVHPALRMLRPTLAAGASSEPALLDLLRRGDAGALGEAYDRHHAAVRAMARRLVGDDQAAEDLVHDTFVTLPGAMRRFEGTSSLRTFLLSIAINHARHYARAAARRRAAMDRLAAEPERRSDDPERAADRAGLARALTRALDTLNIDQRFAFVLCEIEERSCAEAAQLSDVPEATVRTRLFHARKKLRAALEREGFR